MSDFEFIEPQLMRVPLKELIVDHTYQRNVSLDHVRIIARNFDPMLLGVITVNVRTGDSGVYVIDGQHRVEALRQISAVTDVLCLVYYGLDQELEAKLFSGPQVTRRTINPLSRLRASLVAKDPRALEIVEIVQRNGFEIHWGGASTGTAGRIASIQTIEKIHEKVIKGHLDAVLSVIRDGWRERGPELIPAKLMQGLDVTMRRHRNLYDRAILVAAVASTTFDDFEMACKQQPGGAAEARAEAIICKLYNQQVREQGKTSMYLTPMTAYTGVAKLAAA